MTFYLDWGILPYLSSLHGRCSRLGGKGFQSHTMYLSRTAGLAGIRLQPALAHAAAVLDSMYTIVAFRLVTFGQPKDEGIAMGQDAVRAGGNQDVLNRVGRLLDLFLDTHALVPMCLACVLVSRWLLLSRLEITSKPLDKLSSGSDSKFRFV